MKKILSLVLILTMTLAFCSCGEKHDFGNSDFGMSMDEVRTAEMETEKIDEGEDWISYISEVNSIPGQAVYKFSGGELVEIGFESDPYDGYAKDYKKLKLSYGLRYGKPASETDNHTLWSADGLVLIQKKDNTSAIGVVICSAE